MIKAAHTFAGKSFFNLFSYFGLKRNFRRILINGSFADNGKPVLIISNHFSWWDGFIQLQLNRSVFYRKFHVMMLEKQLQKFMILNKAGAFSINPGSRNAIESLNYAAGLLKSNDNLVLFFPQGKIQSIYTNYFHFEKGLDYLLKKCSNDIQLIFNVNLIDYFSEKKPTLSIYFTAFDYKNQNISEIETAFNSFANNCKLQQKEIPEIK